jgi:hypothetical protein
MQHREEPLRGILGEAASQICRGLADEGDYTSLRNFARAFPGLARSCRSCLESARQQQLDAALEALELLAPAYRGDRGLSEMRITGVNFISGEPLLKAARGGAVTINNLRVRDAAGRKLPASLSEVTGEDLESNWASSYDVIFRPSFVERLLCLPVPAEYVSVMFFGDEVGQAAPGGAWFDEEASATLPPSRPAPTSLSSAPSGKWRSRSGRRGHR